MVRLLIILLLAGKAFAGYPNPIGYVPGYMNLTTTPTFVPFYPNGQPVQNPQPSQTITPIYSMPLPVLTGSVSLASGNNVTIGIPNGYYTFFTQNMSGQAYVYPMAYDEGIPSYSLANGLSGTMVWQNNSLFNPITTDFLVPIDGTNGIIIHTTATTTFTYFITSSKFSGQGQSAYDDISDWLSTGSPSVGVNNFPASQLVYTIPTKTPTFTPTGSATPTPTSTGVIVANFPAFPTLPPTPQYPVSVVAPVSISGIANPVPLLWPTATYTFTSTYTFTPTPTGSATPTPTVIATVGIFTVSGSGSTTLIAGVGGQTIRVIQANVNNPLTNTIGTDVTFTSQLTPITANVPIVPGNGVVVTNHYPEFFVGNVGGDCSVTLDRAVTLSIKLWWTKGI
jgi:hypothetical protein